MTADLSCALQEWVARFQAADLVGARVQSPEEVVQDPQMVAALVDVPASPPTNVCRIRTFSRMRLS